MLTYKDMTFCVAGGCAKRAVCRRHTDRIDRGAERKALYVSQSDFSNNQPVDRCEHFIAPYTAESVEDDGYTT